MYLYMIMFYMSLMIIIMFIIFLYLFYLKLVFYLEFNLMKFMSIKLELLILLDWVSILFISVVMMISLMVLIYSIDYMKDDYNIKRFMMMIMMFILSMLLMILSPNLISILLGWDGLGLVSYCLIIYYQSLSSYNSGMITVLMNRLGDILILMSISLMISLGSWNFMFMYKMDNFIYFLLLISSFTKSAQIPFSTWLPMAMAAPTPVSSLVHSSTLVTAGVYLMIRLNYLLMNKYIINYLMMISILTMFLSGLGASFEFDLKKIIALSTLSQLGLMFFSLSLKLNDLTLFHLLTHAMFKSMLFMCAGVIIHNMNGCQDIRFISMVLFNMPMISILFNCSSLSLCGFPFMSGFFSKDLILEMFLMNNFNKFILMMLFMSMGLTIMYTIRLMYYSFIKLPRMIVYNSYVSFMSYMGMSMYLLFIFSFSKGLILSWILFSMKNMIYLSMKLKMMIYVFMLMGIFAGFLVNVIFLKFKFISYLNKFNMFFSMLWFMPMLFSAWIPMMFKFSSKLINQVELGWIEYIMGHNLILLFKKLYNLDFFFKNYLYMLIFIMMLMLIYMF